MNNAPTELEVFIHDIASPLTNIGISLENMKSHIYSNPRKLEKTIVATIDSLEYLYTITKQNGLGKSMNESSNYHLSELVREIITNKFQFILDKNLITYFYDIQEDIVISYDKQLLNRVITNVISNSVDALIEKTTSKSKKLKISIKYSHNEIAISILDNGIGIENKSIKELFNYGYSEKDFHSGIGLPVSKNIVEKRFGGKFIIQSLKGIGTIVKIYLPV